MEIIRDIDEIGAKLRHPAVTIGNFDGVHLGHREIFRRVRRLARAAGGVSVVITFVPHPLQVLRPEANLQLITTPEEKEALIEASGIDYLVEIHFDQAFAAISAEGFVEEVLVERIGMEYLVIGYDYAFGRGREGDATLLRKLGARHDYSVEVLPPIAAGTTVYSSTKVRNLVSEGDVAGVVGILGRHYSLSGIVVPGKQRGRALGFPTANLVTAVKLYPACGVYAVKVRAEGKMYDGACNIGTNPTFQNGEQSLEVFLFDYEGGELYGKELGVFFFAHLRAERRFPDPEALKKAIAADVARCREILRDAVVIEYHDLNETTGSTLA